MFNKLLNLTSFGVNPLCKGVAIAAGIIVGILLTVLCSVILYYKMTVNTLETTNIDLTNKLHDSGIDIGKHISENNQLRFDIDIQNKVIQNLTEQAIISENKYAKLVKTNLEIRYKGTKVGDIIDIKPTENNCSDITALLNKIKDLKYPDDFVVKE